MYPPVKHAMIGKKEKDGGFRMTWNERITLLIAGAALLLSGFTFVTEWVRERKKATIDAYNHLENEALDKLYFYKKEDVERISRNAQSREYKELTLMLARFDQFAAGVNTKVYDIKTLRKLAGSYIWISYDKLRPLINVKRDASQGFISSWTSW